jgi:hypothetical protein
LENLEQFRYVRPRPVDNDDNNNDDNDYDGNDNGDDSYDNDNSDDNFERPYMKPIFTALIRTNGHAVDIILTRQLSTIMLPDLELEDFKDAEVNGLFEVWELDPRMKDIYTATNRDDIQLRIAQQMWNHPATSTTTANDRITEIESNIPTTKTVSSTTFIALYTLAHLL